MGKIIHLDGIDKTGKTTWKNKIIKLTHGNVLVYDRSYMSQIAYARIYGRNIDEQYFFSEAFNVQKMFNHIFILLIAEIQDIIERIKQNDEKDIIAGDIANHLFIFDSVKYEFQKKDIEIRVFNTSDIMPTPENIENICQIFSK